MGFIPAPGSLAGLYAFGHPGGFTPAPTGGPTPPPTSFDPATLSGKLLWLRGKDLGAAGTTVATWADASGRGHTATGINPAGLVVAGAATPAGGKALSVTGSTSSLSLPRLDNSITSVSASSFFSSEPPPGGVDTGANTFWTTNATQTGWLAWQYAAGFVAQSYAITSRAINAGARNPKDWTLEGSNDGATWTVLDTQTGQTWPSGAIETRSFPVTGAASFDHYRLNVTANNGDSYLSVAGVLLPDAPGGVVRPLGAEAWAVVKADTTSKRSLWGLGGAAQSFYPFTDGKVYESFGFSSPTARVAFTPTLALSQWRLYRVAVDATTWQAWLDNASQASSPPDVGWRWTPQLLDSSAGAKFQGGQLAEVLVRDRVSTPDEVGALTDYFNREHGLSVPLT